MMWITLWLVLSAAVLLALSLLPTRKIIRVQEQQGWGWRILYVLVLFFIPAYLLYAWLLTTRIVESTDIIVAFIFFGGSVFVNLVTRLSLISIQHIQHIAALERHHALHDDLTNLPNRSLLYERIEQLVVTTKRSEREFSVLIMDLDQFKEINDTLGHLCGDRLLQQVAPCLRQAVRESDTVARLGGDEFAVLLPDTGIQGAINLSQKILEAMDSPFVVEGHHLKVGISIGITVFPQHGLDCETRLQRAEVAMYVAKRGSLGYSIYNAEHDQYTLNRLTLFGNLHQAMQAQQLELYYQPIVDIQTQRVWGVEALTRWPHAELGFIAPVDFIPLAEQSGNIRYLTQWVINTAIQQIQQWRQRNISMQVSINLSVKDIQDEQFASQIIATLREADIDTSLLTFEITEGSMMTDSERAHKTIKELHDSGISIAIDDFGTGFSSLSYLKQLPTQHIKIDKSFIMDMLEDDNDAIIVRSTIDLAHNMGRKVIAEGVNQQDILDLLEILRCNYAQGFHICPPLPAHKLNDWLADPKTLWKSA